MVQSFRLPFYAYTATGCASLTRGHEDIVFQTITKLTKISNNSQYLNQRIIHCHFKSALFVFKILHLANEILKRLRRIGGLHKILAHQETAETLAA